ncbi:MAG: hypothetical protein AAFX54_17545 [Pseudomonadota bacterium]
MLDESIIARPSHSREREVRLYIRMDCSEGAAMVAADWFNELSRKLRMRFPGASITTRQGLMAYVLQDGEDEDDLFVRVDTVPDSKTIK